MRLLSLLSLVGGVAAIVIPQLFIDVNITLIEDRPVRRAQNVFKNPNIPSMIYDSGTSQYTGYSDVPSGHRLFFWWDPSFL